MASNRGGGDQGNGNVLVETENLLKDFIYRRIQRDGDGITVTREQLGGGPCVPVEKEMGRCLQQVGDELDANVHFQRMMYGPSIKPTKESFLNVAREVFSDGKFNWGRVVALFCFACRLVKKALEEGVPDIIKKIIGWTMDYICENVIGWIRAQGGWAAVWSHFGTPTRQVVGVLLAAALTVYVVTR